PPARTAMLRLARLGHHVRNPGAAGVVVRLLVGLLDHVNFHGGVLVLNETGYKKLAAAGGLPQVLDRDVDQPGAERAFFLVGVFSIVLHLSSPDAMGCWC
ncbi:MAG: hypothetical protein ABJC89_24695, partial [Acidobacteriota bacterium]